MKRLGLRRKSVDKELTPKQKSAIQRVKQNPDLQRLLFKQATGIKWFFPFKEAGFLNPEDIPAPVPGKKANHVSIPAWSITDYLVSTSKDLNVPENEKYAREFLSFMRKSTKHAKDRDYGNYHVWWQFSKIIQNIPCHLIESNLTNEMSVVDYWLEDKYERELVASSLGEEWLIQLLKQESTPSKAIALSLLKLIYKTEVVDKNYNSHVKKEAVFRFDSQDANKITKKAANKVGQVIGQEAVSFFQSSLEKLLTDLGNDKWSSIWRPAICDHDQNLRSADAANVIIVTYRDSLIAFIKHFPDEANDYINNIIQSTFETVRRVAIYAIDQQYEKLNHLLNHVISERHFTSNFQHELWHFLRNHYSEIPDTERQLIQARIVAIDERDDNGQRVESRTNYTRAIWLAAIKDSTDNLAKLFRTYVDKVGGEPEHPDFSRYMTAGFVEHKSPVSKEELLTLDMSQLIDRLKKYQDGRRFNEPGIEGLAKELRLAVKSEPLRFYNQLHHFLRADLAYVYELIEAYSRLWIDKVHLPWLEIWKELLKFCKDIVSTDEFWEPENAKQRQSFVANRHWVVGSISRLIEDGTKNDEHVFPEEYLPSAEEILKVILAKESGEDFKEDSDAVIVAINSSRGRCLEAMISLTMRSCRLGDNQHKDHSGVWAKFEPFYNDELSKSECDEYEFATLVVNFLPNFLYMSKNWVMDNIGKIFDKTNRQKWLCAMQGYVYIERVYEEIFKFLKNNGHFISALDDEILNEVVTEKIIQNIAVAYISDFEKLDDEDSLIGQLIRRNKHNELSQLIWFFETLRQDDDGKVKSKAFEIWPQILNVIDVKEKEGRQLASSLCDFAVFIDVADKITKPLILAVTPFIDEGHHSYNLMKSIARISKEQPAEAYEIWLSASKSSYPSHPAEDIKTALANLVSAGDEGIRMAKKIESLYIKNGNDKLSSMLQEILKSRK